MEHVPSNCWDYLMEDMKVLVRQQCTALDSALLSLTCKKERVGLYNHGFFLRASMVEGRLDIIQWQCARLTSLYGKGDTSNYPPFFHDDDLLQWDAIFYYGHLPIVKWVMSLNPQEFHSVLNFPQLKLLVSPTGSYIHEHCVYLAATNGQTSVLKYLLKLLLHSGKCTDDRRDDFIRCVLQGALLRPKQMNVLQWLAETFQGEDAAQSLEILFKAEFDAMTNMFTYGEVATSPKDRVTFPWPVDVLAWIENTFPRSTWFQMLLYGTFANTILSFRWPLDDPEVMAVAHWFYERQPDNPIYQLLIGPEDTMEVPFKCYESYMAPFDEPMDADRPCGYRPVTRTWDEKKTYKVWR